MHDNRAVANLQPPFREIVEDGILGRYVVRLYGEPGRGNGIPTRITVDLPDGFQGLRTWRSQANQYFGGEFNIACEGEWERDDLRRVLLRMAEALAPEAEDEA